MIDLENAKLVFKKYVSNYNPQNPRIALKIAHTYRVVEVAKQLATSLYNTQNKELKCYAFSNEENIKLAELIGLLHDIGRFEQLKRYDSFIDRQTIDHAKLGIDILTENENKLLNEFCPDEKFHLTIITAISNHNKYKIEELNDENMLTQCKIIRDSDKIDILNLCRYETFETLYKQKDITNEAISDTIFNDFINNVQTNRKEIKTDMDDWILGIGMIFDIYYQESFKILKEKNYIKELFQRVTNNTNREKIEQLEEIADNYITRKCERI